MNKNDLRTPLGKIASSGSAKDGGHHWWLQRLTAIALIPLFLWFIYSLNCYIKAPFYSVYDWITSPFTFVFLTLLIFAIFYHAILGIQVVIEDYIHNKWAKYTTLITVKFMLILMAIICYYSLFSINFGGS